MQEKIRTSVIVREDGIISDINYRNPRRWAKAKLLGSEDKLEKYDYSYISDIINDSDSVVVLNPFKEVSKYTFAFEPLIKYISPNQLEKILWNTYSRASYLYYSHKHYYEKVEPPYKVTFDILIDKLKFYDETVESVGVDHALSTNRWYSMQFLTWALLHDVDNKQALYDRHAKDIRKLMYFESVPSWGMKTITVHKHLDGDKLTNCSNYYLVDLDISDMSEVSSWMWKVIIGSEYRIIPLHITPWHNTIMLISKTLDKEGTIKQLKESIGRAEKIKHNYCW